MKKPKLFTPVSSSGGQNKVFNPKGHIDALYKSSEWQNYSREFLSHNPKCYACGGRSEACDHLKLHEGKLELFWKTDNFLPLCHKCHNTITGRFDRGSVQKLSEKLKWIARSRAINHITTVVKVVPRK